mmetsp:Transcript_18868/g.34041  ORF Transcript_18868/g.34041 Transcript_18868/m.34041 type:complete len:400 (-) Transcript_18868:397-1596(-)
MHLQRYYGRDRDTSRSGTFRAISQSRRDTQTFPLATTISYQILFFNLLKAKGTHSFFLFLYKGFVELEDNGDRKQDTSSSTNCSHEVGNDGESSNAHSTKSSSGRNVPIQNMNEGRVTVSLHDHLSISQLLGNIASRGSRNLNPSLTEQSTGCQDEGEVKDSMERIVDDFSEGAGWRNIVSNATHWNFLSRASLDILPLAQKTDQDIGRGTVVQELGDKVQVGDKGCLEDDGHVGSVEQLDRVGSILTTVLLVLDGKVDTPTLEIDDNHKDQDSREKVGQVGKILTVECLTKSSNFIITGDKKMEESNDSTFELSSTSCVDGGRTERLPDNGFTNVGSNEKRDTGSKTIPLLQKLVESKDNQTSAEKLKDNQDGVTGTDGSKITVHSTDNIGNRFAERD